MTTTIDSTRRALLLAAPALALAPMASALAPAAADPWARARAIAAQCRTRKGFRKQDFLITAFGAQPCGTRDAPGYVAYDIRGTLRAPVADAHDCFPAIDGAIRACHQAGGGRVVVPAGNWLSAGPIILRSNVHVHLAKGARVFFSTEPADYARHGEHDCGANGRLVVSRWQGNDCLNFSSMVYAHGQDNIALTGEDWTSILDGQGGVDRPSGDSWWGWTGRQKKPAALAAFHQGVPNPRNDAALLADAPQAVRAGIANAAASGQSADAWSADQYFLPLLSEAGVPPARRVFGLGHYLRPSMIELVGCSNVLLAGYQVNGAPFWVHHPVDCRNVHMKGVHMDSMGPNSDGFDPESCDTVLVEQCTFNTGDDCIAIKAGKNRDSGLGASRNIVIQDCVMNCGHGGVTLGSEMAGGIENVYVQDVEFLNKYWREDPLGSVIRLKTNMNRGGFLRHLYARRLAVPNGVKVRPGFYKPLPGSPIAPGTVSTGGGAVVTIDCDYTPRDDTVRIRPPVVEHIHISDMVVGNVQAPGGLHSGYQAILVLGPVAGSYNGAGSPAIAPVRHVTITDCDFGMPANGAQPMYFHNIERLVLKNVRAGGKVFNQTVTA